MKHYLLFLLAFFSIGINAQTANGTETKVNHTSRMMNPQTVTTIPTIATMGADGTIGRGVPENLSINQPPHPINYSVTTPTLGGHLIGIDTRLGQIGQTTAGQTQRIYWTGDNVTVNAVDYFGSSALGKGSTPSASPTSLVNGDNQKQYFTKDIISIAQPANTLSAPGIYSGQLSVMKNAPGDKERFTVEVYKATNLGVPIASGITGAPVGNKGVTVIAILDSGEITLSADALTNITISGILLEQLTLNAGERVLYHVSAAKVGTAGGNVTYTVYYGSNHSSYYDVPVATTTDGVINKSDVTGLTTSDALDYLNSTKEDKSNKGIPNGYASLDSDGKVPVSQIPVEELDWFEQISMDITQQSTNETHTSEADIQRYGDDLYRVFRYELNGDHTGNAGNLYMQKSTDFGVTWQAKTVVFSEPTYDNRNSTFGIIGTKFVVFFRKYNATTAATFDIGYITSDDFGATWSGFTSVNSLFTTAGLVPFGDVFTDGVKHYASFFELIPTPKCEWLESSDGGATWTFSKTIYSIATTGTESFGEPFFQYLGSNTYIGLLRNSAEQTGSFFQIESVDNGVTWSAPVETNLGKYQGTAPQLYYDSSKDILHSVVCERYIPVGSIRSDDQPYFVFKLYANDPSEVLGNETNWRQISEQHYRYQKTNQYGYPSMVKVGTDKYLVNYTERYFNFGGKEVANLFQFEINTGLTNRTAPTVQEGTRIISNVGQWESRNNVDFAANTAILNRVQQSDVDLWNSTPWSTLYGLSSAVQITNYNFNNSTTTDKATRFILASGTTTNAPINGNSYYVLEMTTNPIGDKVQIAVGRTSTDRGKIYVRYYNISTGAVGWFELANSTELALKANISNPTFTGDPKAPTPAIGDNDTSIATTASMTTALTPKITITTAVSITTATNDAGGLGQNGRHVVIDNGANVINLTCNGSVTASYGKVGTGAITFVQGSGRTLVQLSGTAVFNGIAGSTATLWSNGTTDYLEITNY